MIRRVLLFIRIGFVAPFIIVLLVGAISILWLRLSIPWLPAIVVVFPAPVVIYLLVLSARLRRDDFLVCTTCGYSLVGRSDRGSCPECGEPYEHAALRRRWFWALLGRRDEPVLRIPDRPRDDRLE